jgi:hypothetical protein
MIINVDMYCLSLSISGSNSQRDFKESFKFAFTLLRYFFKEKIEVLTRYCIGHVRFTHSYLLNNE